MEKYFIYCSKELNGKTIEQKNKFLDLEADTISFFEANRLSSAYFGRRMEKWRLCIDIIRKTIG